MDEEAEMALPKIVSRDEWLIARKEFLLREKAFDHERDRLTSARQNLPMVEVHKDYSFDAPSGEIGLTDLFGNKRQLIIYHLMFEPERDTACKHCSCVMDNIGGSVVHLTARDTAFAAVSRAPLAKIEAFKSRMGWDFPWVSSFRTDFNQDYQVTLDPSVGLAIHNYRPMAFRGELPGLSVFLRNGSAIYHTYSTYLRGIDMLLPMYHLLDRTPFGRQETQANSMHAGEASWIRYHDDYAVSPGKMDTCCHGGKPTPHEPPTI